MRGSNFNQPIYHKVISVLYWVGFWLLAFLAVPALFAPNFWTFDSSWSINFVLSITFFSAIGGITCALSRRDRLFNFDWIAMATLLWALYWTFLAIAFIVFSPVFNPEKCILLFDSPNGCEDAFFAVVFKLIVVTPSIFIYSASANVFGSSIYAFSFRKNQPSN